MVTHQPSSHKFSGPASYAAPRDDTSKRSFRRNVKPARGGHFHTSYAHARNNADIVDDTLTRPGQRTRRWPVWRSDADIVALTPVSRALWVRLHGKARDDVVELLVKAVPNK